MLRCLLFFATLISTSTLWSDQYHYSNILIGERAIGLGVRMQGFLEMLLAYSTTLLVWPSLCLTIFQVQQMLFTNKIRLTKRQLVITILQKKFVWFLHCFLEGYKN